MSDVLAQMPGNNAQDFIAKNMSANIIDFFVLFQINHQKRRIGRQLVVLGDEFFQSLAVG